MISLIIGNKGSGKTKHLIEEVNKALASSNGHVICVEKMMKLTYEIKPQVRLINADEYLVSGFDVYYGFLAGLCSGDADITDILCDGTLRIGGRDPEDLANFLEKVDKLSKITGVKFTFTISEDESDVPERVFEFCEKI